ncbi:proteasome regulatory particle subunit [Teratosphaeriaceae sp. CCFEE 6253]|nr:proteasome regulatory particle subunit [Teratosphaeriaceae sp. CCFEE 6253]
MGDPQYLKYPQLALAQSVFTLAAPSTTADAKQSALTTLQDAIREHKMAPLYAYLAHPQTGQINASGESSSSAVLSPTLSRSNTNMSSTGPPSHPSRRKSSISGPSIVGVLGGKTDISVELPWDEALYNELKADNEKEVAAIAKEEEEAAERAGETEVTAAQSKRAELYARIGDKDAALAEFEKLLEKTGILATKIDIVLAIIRIALFFDDKLLARTNISRASTLVESGGDWDRRNRLKAYQGLHLLTIRAQNLAAPLLLDSLSTFTSSELCPYSSLVVYATLAGAVSLPRRDFKSRVVDAPEIRAIFGADSENDRLSALSSGASAGQDEEMAGDDATTKGATTTPKPTAVNLTALASGSASADAQAAAEPKYDFKPLSTLINALYTGQYSAFFRALSKVETDFLSQDRYLYEHRRWYVREMRLSAYTQLLASYRVLSLASMADSFGVSVEWLDKDLAPFIAGQRLQATIDRVAGVVSTVRAEGKGRQYHEVVRQGDGLITKLQKYGQVVRLRGSERS